MPIGSVDGVLWVEFGRGDVAVRGRPIFDARNRREGRAVTLGQLRAPQAIGSTIDDRGESDPVVMLCFDRPESIDVVLHVLKDARDRLVNGGYGPWPVELDRWADDGGRAGG